MPPINTVIITDFDGTATGVPGSNLVFTPFYSSLLVGGKGDYKSTPMLDKDALQAKFEAEFDGKRDDSRLISQAAENYFRKALADESFAICINTKNRNDYIQAMLRYLNFTEEEISRISIKDSGWKGSATTTYLDEIQEDVSAHASIIILDDSQRDHDAMVKAANDHDLVKRHHVTVISHRQAPSQFDAVWQNLSLVPLQRPKTTLISYSFALKALRAIAWIGIAAAITAVIVAATVMSGGTAGLLIGAGIAVELASGYGVFKTHEKIQMLTPEEAAIPVLAW